MKKQPDPVKSAVNTRQHARVAALQRHRAPDDTDLLDAKRQLQEDVIAKCIASSLAKAPPLRPEQIERLSKLLHPRLLEG